MFLACFCKKASYDIDIENILFTNGNGSIYQYH